MIEIEQSDQDKEAKSSLNSSVNIENIIIEGIDEIEPNPVN